MPLPAVLVTLTAAGRKALKKRVRGARAAWRDRLRALIVLAAAMGRSNARIAQGPAHQPGHGAQVAGPVPFLSVIQKKVVTSNDFDSLGQLSATLLGFVDRHNQTARPFSWKFIASDLHDLMDRISRHEQQQTPRGQPLPKAA